MIKIVLIGSGNVATHLYRAFSNSEKVQVIQVYNHAAGSLQKFQDLVPTTTSLSELAPADVYLIALKDDVIAPVGEALQHKEGLVAHTSGAVSLEALSKCRRAGVFYPLQTFSSQRDMNYKEIPFCLEARSQKDLALLRELAREISEMVHEISTDQRKKLHLSAVFVCNFVNHLYTIGERICKEEGIPFEILQPLIKETAEKIRTSSPAELQTGPAIRADEETIKTHLELIDVQEIKNIYQTLTKSIQSSHGKKL